MLENTCSGNQFPTCKEIIIALEDITDPTISLRETARKYLNCGGYRHIKLWVIMMIDVIIVHSKM